MAPPTLTEPASLPLTPQDFRAPGRPPRGSSSLRRILVLADAGAAALAWFVVLCLPELIGRTAGLQLTSVAAVGLAALITVVLSSSFRLYRARHCVVRAVESVRIAQVATIAMALLVLGEERLGIAMGLAQAFGGGFLAFLLQRLARSTYRSWMDTHRRAGRHSRPVVLLGSNEEALDLMYLAHDHPEFGYRICGVMGDPDGVVARDFDLPFLGPLSGPEVGHVAEVVRAHGANGVLVASGAFSFGELNRFVRACHAAHLHVHFSTGLWGIDHRRLRSQPLGYEPLLYLEPPALRQWQVVVKRVLDLTLAAVGLVAATPVMVACAFAIKAADRGPVLFRQRRVGRGGETFEILKFRSMVTDAEARLAELAARNERDGALFKLSGDPRITRVGRLLRATSLDELPQLVNVLRGQMSLVGPRPALPSEVGQFDEELLARHQVLPGITGLWQVQARDQASFRTYQRLDLFYVENWSVGLDLAILAGTVRSVFVRGLRALLGQRAGRSSLAAG